MALLDELAQFITNVRFEDLSPETVAQAKLHIFDSLGALLVGTQTEEAKANRDLVLDLMAPARGAEGTGVPVPGFDFSAPLPMALFLSCIATRMTETDDIDIASCTTIGSVVIPAALLTAFKQGATGKTCIEGVVAGYELFARLGAAVNGAEIIYRGLWPTYLCGAFAVAAIGSKVMGLDPGQTKNALAMSLTLSTGISGKTKTGLSSRWLTLGCAAQNGLIAYLAGARGFAGDQAMLEGPFNTLYGLNMKPEILLDGLGKTFRMGSINLKPFCSARQAVASIEAFRRLLREQAVDPEAIEEVEVILPKQYSQMLDMPGFPENRLSSITSIRYQLALAAFYEDDLFDVERKVLRNEARVRAFMEKVRIVADDRLTAMYPKKWSGRIALKVGGSRLEQEVLSPKGDSDQPMTWEDVEEKAKKLVRPFFETEKIEKLGAMVKGLDGTEKVDSMLHFLQRS
jgi:2-methylcitrate dehydratase PrpD